jgi:hypothetical protein
MATWEVDTRYCALNLIKPNTIIKRWKEVEPWALHKARQTDAPERCMADFKSRHADRLARLLRSGISLKAIRNGYLDNPSLEARAFEFGLDQAVQRHYDRMGRVKGQGRWSKAKKGAAQ